MIGVPMSLTIGDTVIDLGPLALGVGVLVGEGEDARVDDQRIQRAITGRVELLLVDLMSSTPSAPRHRKESI